MGIPEGSFDMGTESTDDDWLSQSRPVHRVMVPSFYMGKYEVTQAQWWAVMGTDPSSFSGDDRPVDNVNWSDATQFCTAVSDLTGYSVRLPSEAEWEYACKGDHPYDDYAWAHGDDESLLIDYAWYDPNGGDETHPVGQALPNGFGLFDTHGNVWEWCEDVWHDGYSGAPTDGGAWTTGGVASHRVIHGGSYRNNSDLCRMAYRGKATAALPANNVGFRVAATIVAQSRRRPRVSGLELGNNDTIRTQSWLGSDMDIENAPPTPTPDAETQGPRRSRRREHQEPRVGAPGGAIRGPPTACLYGCRRDCAMWPPARSPLAPSFLSPASCCHSRGRCPAIPATPLRSSSLGLNQFLTGLLFLAWTLRRMSLPASSKRRKVVWLRSVGSSCR